MTLRLSGDQLQLQDGNGVGNSRLFDALHGSADLGDLMGRVIDVYFDGRHEASVPAGMTGVTSISLQSLDRGEW